MFLGVKEAQRLYAVVPHRAQGASPRQTKTAWNDTTHDP